MDLDNDLKETDHDINKFHLDWTWDPKYKPTMSELSENNLEVTFHPDYSIGTAVVRGNMPLKKGNHYYWEIKMLTYIYGTDVMIGVGTDKIDLTNITKTFCSLLGRDRESWGYSYKGFLQHAGEKHNYTACFLKNSIIGVHLDTWNGTLQFFTNRKPLGIAFTGLKDVVLYPMVSSTAAHTRIKLIYSCSMPISLQAACLSVLPSIQRQYISSTYPALRYLTESAFADILQKNLETDTDEEIIEFLSEYTTTNLV
ncbi:SPRY domain-containing SOCS box protein 3-like isoform X1 [Vespa crabro]|uniref:SPRY domain-containing SOCS box protein 3-like isoform X1 n=1 Tax=Vespa crabro TaxID=7445 RepID=UPI001F025592|nr:SPRY domain-containing SOCS box protein 3-like isoform X1 [Vespa crabro]